MKRRTFLHAVAVMPAAYAHQPLSARERYRIDASVARSAMLDRIAQGGEFDAELARFELKAQLLREKHNVFLWDGPTTARGYRHPSWPQEA
ncbi:MAG TPA: hypothetical protein K8W01_17790 [Methylorubrum populi]|uniref:Uncharacterized protein n=1 Tax=Methylorubrum populi TaxID=223967 RepID=A0A921JGC3_9HYPH|nr:hypothetical protein [Methylorubrum populi]